MENENRDDLFWFAGEIVGSGTWAVLSFDASNLYLVLRAIPYDRHVLALWAEDNREWREREFYPAFDASDYGRLLAILDGCPAGPGEVEPDFRPYLPITVNGGARKEYAYLAGIKDSNHNRRNKRFAAAVADLVRAGLLVVFEYGPMFAYGRNALLFPLPKVGIWGK